jgi:hypothetical protein
VEPSAIIFVVFLILACFNAGTMTTLQLQHYAIYPQVGRESFAAYLRANNRAALVPAILLFDRLDRSSGRPAHIYERC